MTIDVHGPKGGGTEACLMVADDNFRPAGPGPFFKGLGPHHLRRVYDRNGKLVDQRMPDMGACKAD